MREFWTRHWSDTHFANEFATNFYPRRQEEFEAIIRHLPRDGQILEAGCSFGHVAEYLRSLGYQVVGLDYVYDSLALGQTQAPELNLTQGDIHALPFADNSLGAYLSFGVLEHFEFGPIPALREAFRTLKPGGVVAVTMPVPTKLVRKWIPQMRPWLSLDPLRRNPRLRRLFGKQSPAKTNGNGGGGFYERPYSAKEVRDFLDAAGFKVISQMPVYHSFWWWLLGSAFREKGSYYKSNRAGEMLARCSKTLLPWSTAFMGLAIGVKPCDES